MRRDEVICALTVTGVLHALAAGFWCLASSQDNAMQARTYHAQALMNVADTAELLGQPIDPSHVREHARRILKSERPQP